MKVIQNARELAVKDGKLIDVSVLADEANIRFPVFVTKRVWEEYVLPDDQAKKMGESTDGRLWDLVWMLYRAMRGKDETKIRYQVIFTRGGVPEEATLEAVVGPGDNLEPVLTVMLPAEFLFTNLEGVKSRQFALETGELFDISQFADPHYFPAPIAVTREVWETYILPNDSVKGLRGQTTEDRIKAVLELYQKATDSSGPVQQVDFLCFFLMENREMKLVELNGLFHAGDKGEPVFTIMLPHEEVGGKK